MRAVEKEYGLREVNAWPIQALNLHCAVLEIPPDADRAALLAVLSKDKRIKLTQPLQTFATRTAAYNDPYVELQRGFQQMDVAGAHALSRGEGVKVAIIDTGADILHPDLRGSIAAAANFVDYQRCPVPPRSAWHGDGRGHCRGREQRRGHCWSRAERASVYFEGLLAGCRRTPTRPTAIHSRWRARYPPHSTRMRR